MTTEITTANAATINGILESLQQEPITWGAANLKRTYAKLMQLTMERPDQSPSTFASPRYKIASMGDSIMWRFRTVLVPLLQSMHGWGGVVGRIASESGLLLDPSTTAETISDPVIGPLTGPIHEHYALTSGENVTFRLGNPVPGNNIYNNLPGLNTDSGDPYDEITEVVIYYEKKAGAGTFKVQYTSNGVDYTDVPGLTSINAATDGTGTAAVGFARATGLNLSISRIRVLNLSGTVQIYGGGCMRDSGVVDMPWSIGGTDQWPIWSDGRLASILEEEDPDCIMFRTLDGPTVGTDYEGMTQAEYADAILNDFDAFWGGLTVEPDVIYVTPNDTDGGTAVNTPASRASWRQHAVDNSKTFVDTVRAIGFYADANSLGFMSDGTHEHAYANLVACSRFLADTGLGIWPTGYHFRELYDITANGTTKLLLPGGDEVVFPADSGGTYGSDLAMEIKSDAGVYGSGIGLTSTAGSGRKYMVVSRGSGSFEIIEASGSAKAIISFNGTTLFRVGAFNGVKVGIGNVGSYMLYQLHGVQLLTAGTATVINTNITTSTRIFVTRRTRGGTPGICYEAIPAAGSFTINSYDGSGALQTLDTSAVAWFAVEP